MAQDSTPENPEEQATLTRARAAFVRSTGGDVGDDSTASEGMFAAIERDLAEERGGWLSRLREQSTGVRRGLLLLGLSLLVAARLWSLGEGHLNVTPRVTASLVVLSLLMGVLVVLGLRPLHRPALPWRAELAAALGSLSGVFILSLWPTVGTDGMEHVAAPEAWRCFGMGVMVAAPVYAAVRILHRGTWMGGLFAALLAGVAANLVLTTHCPSAAAGHTLAGHFLVMAVAGAAYVVGTRLSAS